jgi:hypothetical protein
MNDFAALPSESAETALAMMTAEEHREIFIEDIRAEIEKEFDREPNSL